jgi:hypothetical protein
MTVDNKKGQGQEGQENPNIEIMKRIRETLASIKNQTKEQLIEQEKKLTEDAIREGSITPDENMTSY